MLPVLVCISQAGLERTSFAITHSGEGDIYNDPDCSARFDTFDFAYCHGIFDCKCLDVRNNTYACVRSGRKPHKYFQQIIKVFLQDFLQRGGHPVLRV